jgi:hypothetical protein
MQQDHSSKWVQFFMKSMRQQQWHHRLFKQQSKELIAILFILAVLDPNMSAVCAAAVLNRAGLKPAA